MQKTNEKPIAASQLRIKPEFQQTVIGFNGSSLPLGKRKDLDRIYEFAKSNYPKWLEFFEPVSPKAMKQIQSNRANAFLKRQEDKSSTRAVRSQTKTKDQNEQQPKAKEDSGGKAEG